MQASSGEESVTTVGLTVSLSETSTLPVSVGYEATGGAAGDGTDFTLLTTTLMFGPGETSTNIMLTVADDSIDETDETVEVTLVSPSNAELGPNATHTYTILDDDPQPTVTFDLSESSGEEATTTVAVIVSLSQPSGLAVSVEYAVNGTATSGADYTVTISTLEIPPGETSTSIVLTIVDDSIAESDETVVVTLTAPSKVTLGQTTTHTYTIKDND